MMLVIQAANDEGARTTIAARRAGLFGRLEGGWLRLQSPADRRLIDRLRGSLSIADLEHELRPR